MSYAFNLVGLFSLPLDEGWKQEAFDSYVAIIYFYLLTCSLTINFMQLAIVYIRNTIKH